MLSLHDPQLPLYIEGPNVCYMQNKKVQYFVMRSATRTEVEAEFEEGGIKKVTSEEWWSKFYGQDFKYGHDLQNDGKSYFEEETFLPQVKFEEVVSRNEKTSELREVDGDVDEGRVYALAATENKSVDALRCWVAGLLQDNKNMKNLNILFKPEQDCFLQKASKQDPNKEDAYF